jgi:UDP-glucose 4-epimerase
LIKNIIFATMQNILITGSGGYIGKLFLEKCASLQGTQFDRIIAMDIKLPPADQQLIGVTYVQMDIRSKEVEELLPKYKIDTVVHLAAIIAIAGQISRETEYEVDVLGSSQLIDACVKHQVKKFITTSSGAAYGYWPSNVDTWLTEDMPMKGNYELPYSYHKWLVEEKLKDTLQKHTLPEQYVFRVGTILGKTTSNPITDFLKKDKILCLSGYKSPFVAIWDMDLVEILYKATQNSKSGIYNVAGDGAIPTPKLAEMMGKPTLSLPVSLLKFAFKILRPLGLVPYGPESLKFIQYRPVLSNEKLKNEFGYTPQKNTLQVFEYWMKENVKL